MSGVLNLTRILARTARTKHSIRQIGAIFAIKILVTDGVQCVLADLRGNHSHVRLQQNVGTIPATKLGVAPTIRLHSLPVECLSVRTLKDDTI